MPSSHTLISSLIWLRCHAINECFRKNCSLPSNIPLASHESWKGKDSVTPFSNFQANNVCLMSARCFIACYDTARIVCEIAYICVCVYFYKIQTAKARYSIVSHPVQDDSIVITEIFLPLTYVAITFVSDEMGQWSCWCIHLESQHIVELKTGCNTVSYNEILACKGRS